MAYKVIILYRLYMPSYFLGTFTEYPCLNFAYIRVESFFGDVPLLKDFLRYFSDNRCVNIPFPP